jgi:osmotically inducible protein OsmC
LSFRVIRRSEATWQGTAAEGGGRLKLGSGAYEGPFTLRARVEEVERATNPEELIAAAEAGCFTMSLANVLTEEGHPPVELRTTAAVRLEQQEGRFAISLIELRTGGQVPGVDERRFAELAQRAKETCPVSRALAGTQIELEVSLTETAAIAGGQG